VLLRKKEVFFLLNNSKEKKIFVTEGHSKKEIKYFKTKQAKENQIWLKEDSKKVKKTIIRPKKITPNTYHRYG
jgi:hypothetical protein